MTDTHRQSNGGLVKNLLFPSFVDAGANDAFHEKTERDDACNASVCYSDASTEVKHNLSFPSAKTTASSRRLPQAYSADEFDARKRNNQQQPASAPSTPSFFASTNPQARANTPVPVSAVTLAAKTSILLLQPASPPTVPRFTRSRSLSQSVAEEPARFDPKLVGKTQSFSPTMTHAASLEWTNNDPNIDERPSLMKITVETKDFTTETANSKVLAATEYNEASVNDTMHQQLLHQGTLAITENVADGDDGNELLESNERDKKSLRLGNGCSPRESAAEPHSQGRSTFSTHADQYEDLLEEVTLMDHANEQYGADNAVEHNDHWEEEATPLQTAFGKELMFRRDEFKRRNGDDDASTVSEMGTVVGVDRMQDLDDMQDYYHNNGGEGECQEIQAGSHREDLSLPMLDQKLHYKHQSITRDFEDEKKSEKDVLGDNIFSKAIRRIGSFRDAASTAPNTPRRVVQALTPSGHIPEDAPASFLLRSPGSSVHFAAKSEYQRNMLAPRFMNMKQPTDAATPKSDYEQDARSFGSQMTRQLSLARGCFSFDTYDTTVDDAFEVSYHRQSSHAMFRPSVSWDVASHQERRPPLAQSTIPFRPRSSHIRQRSKTNDAARFHVPQQSANVNDRAQSPNRLEIEREDALDILACLVERGISLREDEDRGTESVGVEVAAGVGARSKVLDDIPKPDVLVVVQQLKDHFATGTSESNTGLVHVQQIAALDELAKSHQYAMEMQRASQSAASWLKSVGRVVGSTQTPEEQAILQSQTTGEHSPEVLDFLTCKAMLNSAQLEIRDKSQLVDQLNEDLARCKAEIGRLRSAATNLSVSLHSNNRSILDEDIQSDVNEEAGLTGESFPILAPDEVQEDLRRLQEDDCDMGNYRKALDEANDMICKLFMGLKSANGEVACPDDAPVVTVDADTRGVVSPSSETAVWRRLHLPILTAPEHSVRSPSVVAVLKRWTSDTQLHESLLSWIESAIGDVDLSDLPPLMISGLNQEVCDSFVQHVLPCLLRRSGIMLDVKVRGNRASGYDLAVTAETNRIRNASPPQAFTRKSSFGDSTAYSTSTAQMSNTNSPLSRRFTFDENNHKARDYDMKRASSRMSYDEMADAPFAASGEMSPAGIMSTLGGAIGYLSSLRKGQANATVGSIPNTPSRLLESPARPRETALDLNHPEEHGDADDFVHPFHRVLCAPPGRLGISFVEYRGHAVVSDVAPESPLVGFIFPSDVLIAIDETAVSGTRVRNIVKLLKDRSAKQRSLRVISSHDMSALTLHTSMVSDGT